MYNYDLKMIREKKQVTNMSLNYKRIFYPISICCILNISDHAPLCHIARNNMKNVSNKTEEYQSEVGFM